MIYGIGVDIVSTARITRAVARWGDRFLERVYTGHEITHCRGNHHCLAARFAAKEAMIKAISTDSPVSYREVEVVNDEKGMPAIKAHGGLGKALERTGASRVHLSMSHERKYAVACVVIEKD